MIILYQKTNDIIELVIQKPYVITDCGYKKKYDYETDKINTVTIITLNSHDVIIRVAAPYALIVYEYDSRQNISRY